MRSSTVVTATTSSSEVRPTKTAAGTAGPTTSTGATSAPFDDGCGTAVELVTNIGAAREPSTAAAQLEALHDAIGIARPQLPAAHPAMRELVEGLVAYAEHWHAGGLSAQQDARSANDPTIETLTDRLIRQVHSVLLNPLAIIAGFDDVESCSALREIGTAADLATTTDQIAGIRITRDELVTHGQGRIADTYLPEGWLELTDRDMTVALSGMQAEYDRCVIDFDATAYGDNAGCDVMHDACDARELLACNDLYWASNLGSSYEQFAATCGDRTPIGSPASAGFCERLQ